MNSTETVTIKIENDTYHFVSNDAINFECIFKNIRCKVIEINGYLKAFFFKNETRIHITIQSNLIDNFFFQCACVMNVII